MKSILRSADVNQVCERPPAARKRAALPLYEGESKATLPLKQGESRAKHGRGSLTHNIEIT